MRDAHGVQFAGVDAQDRGNDRNAVSGLGELEQDVRRSALGEHIRPDTRDLTGSIEDIAGGITRVEQQQGIIGELSDVD